MKSVEKHVNKQKISRINFHGLKALIQREKLSRQLHRQLSVFQQQLELIATRVVVKRAS